MILSTKLLCAVPMNACVAARVHVNRRGVCVCVCVLADERYNHEEPRARRTVSHNNVNRARYFARVN